MKLLVFILLALIITSCAQKQLDMGLSSRLDRCVEKYIKMDVDPDKVVKICTAIHKINR